ncbi:MAG: acyltransferase [Rickettsiales bacterium]|nr:acyltransferase [Rickettsiales bacterium]
MWQKLTDSEVKERLAEMTLPFNRYGLDPYGVSREHLGFVFSLLAPLYRHYFRVQVHGIENIPAKGSGMVIGNHSGGIPVDASMVLASIFFEMNPPRLVHGMVEKFAQSWPVVSPMFFRMGQLPGLPQHAVRLLQDKRLLMVFPEGVRGIGKLYQQRYQTVRFGTGFMRIALQTGAPIIPFAFIGGEEAYPTLWHLKPLAKLLGAPYVPVPKHIVPVPLPIRCSIHYGEPMYFEGDGNEADDVIEDFVAQVRQRVDQLIEEGRVSRRERLRREQAGRVAE